MSRFLSQENSCDPHRFGSQEDSRNPRLDQIRISSPKEGRIVIPDNDTGSVPGTW